MDLKQEWINYILSLQDRICLALEDADGKAGFLEDKWQRAEGGGGRTRVIANGNVFEKGGVNTSVVFGKVTPLMQAQLKINAAEWFACGLSLVLHPINPFVPTVHCNYRMFELYDEAGNLTERWFGGGADLTPYYLFEDDAIHFHDSHKKVCDAFSPSLYVELKSNCDNYFVNVHRNNERRGIGGIFYDHKRDLPAGSLSAVAKDGGEMFWFNFGKACGDAFTTSYLPIVKKRRSQAYTPNQKYWQEIRRGRYTEFNLVHDRGTIFGLKTNGRTESILMSLPPTVRFVYDHHPAKGSEEDKLLQVCLHPRTWV